jgi:photosystem II stability/assembly factor-like uncharacterized protein
MMSDQSMPETSQLDDFVYSITAAPGFGNKENGVCFAACGSGLYQSEDGGRSWKPAYQSLALKTELTTTSVALSPQFGKDRTLFAGVPGGVLRTMDGCAAWQAATFPPPPPAIVSLVISPAFAEDSTLLAGTMEDGVFYSANRGTTWASWNFGLLDLNTLCLAISPNYKQDETLFSGTGSGLFRSTNGGRAWREVELPCGYDPVLSLAVSPKYARDGLVLAGTETGMLCLSKDGGSTWEALNVTDSESPINAVLISNDFSAKADILLLAGSDMTYSTDGGKNWEPLAVELPDGSEITAVCAPNGFAPGNPVLVGLLGGKILRIN